MQETDILNNNNNNRHSHHLLLIFLVNILISQVLVNIFPVAKFEENTRRVRGGGADHM
jgi:hypothetical protein